jgi:hypothetical protein
VGLRLVKIGAVKNIMCLGHRKIFACIFYTFYPTLSKFGTGDMHRNLFVQCNFRNKLSSTSPLPKFAQIRHVSFHVARMGDRRGVYSALVGRPE